MRERMGKRQQPIAAAEHKMQETAGAARYLFNFREANDALRGNTDTKAERFRDNNEKPTEEPQSGEFVADGTPKFKSLIEDSEDEAEGLRQQRQGCRMRKPRRRKRIQ